MSDVSTARPSPPVTTLTRWQLTLALVVITLIPFGLVVVLYTTMPNTEDPVLPVEISVGPRAWPNEQAENARVVPCAIVRNPTDEEWRNLSLRINKQFQFDRHEPVAAGEEVVVPLKFFHTKGNQYYPPESQPLKLMEVYAQIPSGARAILEIEGQDLKGNFNLP